MWGVRIDTTLGHGSGYDRVEAGSTILGKIGKGTGYFSNDHLCIALGRDTEFKKTKGTGGLVCRLDALVKVPDITHFSDNPSYTELSDESVSFYFPAF